MSEHRIVAMKVLGQKISLALSSVADSVDRFIESFPAAVDSLTAAGSSKRSAIRSLPASKGELGQIVQNYPGFPAKAFSFPSFLGHLELEAIEVDSEKTFRIPEEKMVDKTLTNIRTGEQKIFFSDDPTIATTINRKIDRFSAMLILHMRDCFSFISEVNFETKLGLQKEIAEEVLKKIVGRIMSETGWTFEQVLLSILVRDVLVPFFVDPSAHNFNDIQNTLRFYYTVGDSCRWAAIPYHSPSIDIGELVCPDDSNFPHDKLG